MKTVSDLGKYATERNILLLLENNVLTKANLNFFETNPFLMVQPEEIQNTIMDLDCEVGLLLDLAHLKISSKTLEFSPQDAISYLNPLVVGYQASENDSLEDTGSIFDESAWFMNYLDTSKEFITMELSNCEPSSYYDVEEMLNSFIE
jgi:sugar phosphate isomerase/epimerase